MSPFLKKLASILEVDHVSPEDRLADIETWDSVSAVSVIALIDSDYGLAVTLDNLQMHNTAGSLETFVNNQATRAK